MDILSAVIGAVVTLLTSLGVFRKYIGGFMKYMPILRKTKKVATPVWKLFETVEEAYEDKEFNAEERKDIIEKATAILNVIMDFRESKTP